MFVTSPITVQPKQNRHTIPSVSAVEVGDIETMEPPNKKQKMATQKKKEEKEGCEPVKVDKDHKGLHSKHKKAETIMEWSDSDNDFEASPKRKKLDKTQKKKPKQTEKKERRKTAIGTEQPGSSKVDKQNDGLHNEEEDSIICVGSTLLVGHGMVDSFSDTLPFDDHSEHYAEYQSNISEHASEEAGNSKLGAENSSPAEENPNPVALSPGTNKYLHEVNDFFDQLVADALTPGVDKGFSERL